MSLDLILLLSTVILIYFFVKHKKQIKNMQHHINQIERRVPQDNSEEFTLGLTKLTSEFTGQIILDSLTGLPGREAFNDRLQLILNQSKRFEKSFAVMLLDINEFHLINETQGYETGDLLLKEVATRLQKVIRQIDTMTRYAGNTFIFVLPQLTMPETAAYVAQRLLDSIVQPFKINDQNLFVTASVGVSIYPVDGLDENLLIKNADDALHQSKLGGKGRYQFYRQELHALGQRELSLNSYLNRSDVLQLLHINYQPYQNITSGETIFVQAIPALDLPGYGLISYENFIKAAESTGKILEIGEWLLRSAIVQLKKWHADGFTPEKIIMTTSLKQIENPQFIYKISQIIEELAIDPQQIIFEISESNLFSNSANLEKAFSMLSQVGIQTTICIVTLGHFALQKINKLPINYLKINSRLLMDLANKENEIIIHMIVSLAKDMKLGIIADGVDDEKQKLLLVELGCEIMQGKLFGDALPLNSVG